MKNSDLPASLLNQLEGKRPPEDFESDGCSGGAPDVVGGCDLRPACHVHDYGYQLGGCKRTRQRVDREFFRNLRRCDLGKFLARRYYFAVRLFGRRHFNWWQGRPRDTLLGVLITEPTTIALVGPIVTAAAAAWFYFAR